MFRQRARRDMEHAPEVDPPGTPRPHSFQTESASPSPQKPKSTLATLRSITWTWDILAISVVYLVQGFTDLAGVAVQYYLKDGLNLGPAQAGYAYTVCLLPWNITPVLGLMTDSVPIWGYHRKAYLVLVGLVGCASWFAVPSFHHVVPVTALVFLANLCVAWSQVVADAVTVKLSQRQEMEVAAVFQSLSWINYTVGAVLGGFVTGRLLEAGGPRSAFTLMAACMLLDSGCGLMISEQRAAGAGTEAVVGTRARRRRADSDQGEGEEQMLLHAAAPAGPRVPPTQVWALVQRLWATLRQPHILGAALFIFIWQATPAPSSAMFFFQTNVLLFSPSFMELMYLCGSMSGFLGVLIYNVFLVHRSLRGTLLWASLLGTLLNASQLLLVSRLNTRLGLSDKLFALGDYSMLSVIAEVMLTPMLALAARMCPDGIEATLLATLYSLLNLSRAVSSATGAALTSAFKVTESDFDGLFGLTLVCNLMMLAPLPLLALVPSGSGITPTPLHNPLHTEAASIAHGSNPGQAVSALLAGALLAGGAGHREGGRQGDEEQGACDGGSTGRVLHSHGSALGLGSDRAVGGPWGGEDAVGRAVGGGGGEGGVGGRLGGDGEQHAHEERAAEEAVVVRQPLLGP